MQQIGKRLIKISVSLYNTVYQSVYHTIILCILLSFSMNIHLIYYNIVISVYLSLYVTIYIFIIIELNLSVPSYQTMSHLDNYLCIGLNIYLEMQRLVVYKVTRAYHVHDCLSIYLFSIYSSIQKCSELSCTKLPGHIMCLPVYISIVYF